MPSRIWGMGGVRFVTVGVRISIEEEAEWDGDVCDCCALLNDDIEL